ncbi:MAG: trypsin-like peptidase domain-containing protein [Promethearchaeota archaeon]
MQRQNLILGIILFFFINSSIYVLNPIISAKSSSDDNLSPSYTLEDINVTINYDVLTCREQIEYFNNTSEDQSFQTIIPPFLGETDYNKMDEISNLQISYPFPPDDRIKITSTSSYPWSTICKLYITAEDNTQWVGSGTMIDAYHVLTCGHCVYIHDHGGWASEIIVIPGMRGTYRPFGQALATNFRTYSQWIQFEMPEHDWAVLTLDRTIGNNTGWMGTMTADQSDPVYTGTLHTAGYPYDLDSGLYMYYDSDVGDRATNYNHWYWMDTAGGQSGGPVWVEINGSYYILTVNAYEYEFGVDANFGTRLNQDKFDQIITWLAADTPPVTPPSGLDINIIIIIIVIATLGITIVIMIVNAKRKKPSPDVRLVKPYEEDYTPYNLEYTPPLTQQLRSQAFGFCPNCGKEIFRDTQRFCSNCGQDINIEPQE